jgi:hypothetical protein
MGGTRHAAAAPPRMAQQSVMGQGLLIIEASLSRSDTVLGSRPLDEWSADGEISTWQNTTFTRDKFIWPRLDSNPQSQRPHGHRDWLLAALRPGKIRYPFSASGSVRTGAWNLAFQGFRTPNFPARSESNWRYTRTISLWPHLIQALLWKKNQNFSKRFNGKFRCKI